ncbi:cytochrome c550 [Metabacillus arenae]|uniref:Cytochrome c n=1 Tax=Metabacillus arenae TaxID=2771434 RepID=A0A926NIS7_9BACI|nr:cytochrome c [Metabacillus arenae]MBD1382121.1 cytochrome c [Metabacillus arenae]
MNRNPLIPFALVAVLGIGLMFLLSFKGLGDMKELTGEGKEEEKTEDVANASPEEIFKQNCTSCHGQNLEGGVGPALAGTSLGEDKIKETVTNGKGSGMPAFQGTIPDDKIAELAKWITEQ